MTDYRYPLMNNEGNVLTMTQAHVEKYAPGAANGDTVTLPGFGLSDGKVVRCAAGRETPFKIVIVE